MYGITDGNVYAKAHSKADVPSVVNFQSYGANEYAPNGQISFDRRTGQSIKYFFSDKIDAWPQAEKVKVVARMASHEADLGRDWYEEVFTKRDSASNFGINLYYDADGITSTYATSDGSDINDVYVKMVNVTFNSVNIDWINSL